MHQSHQTFSDTTTVPTILSPESDDPNENEHQRRWKQQAYHPPTGRPSPASSLNFNSSTNMPLSSTHSFPGCLQDSSNSMSSQSTSGNHDPLSLLNGGDAFHSSSETPWHFNSRRRPASEQQSTNFTTRDNYSSTGDVPLWSPSGHPNCSSIISSHLATRAPSTSCHQQFSHLLLPSTPTNTDMTSGLTISSETSPQISNANGPTMSFSGGEPMIRDGSRFSRTSLLSYVHTPVLRSPMGDASMRESRSVIEACQPTIMPASLGYEVNMSQQPTFSGFSTQLPTNHTLEVSQAPSSSTRSITSAEVSAAASAVTLASNVGFPVPRDSNAGAIPHRGSNASGPVAISSTSSTYDRPSHKKVTCQSCKATFKGDHELRRHKQREHSRWRVVWVTKESSADGTFLAGCKACASGRRYKVDYNAAAHLRRIHFHPRERKDNGKSAAGSISSASGCKSGRTKSKKGSDKKRGGKAGGSDPPMSMLKEHWMRKVVEEAANTEEEDEEDGVDSSIDFSATSDDDCNGLSVDSKSALGASDADADGHADGSNANGSRSCKKKRKTKSKGTSTSTSASKGKGKGKRKAIGKGVSTGAGKSKSKNGTSHAKAHSNDNGGGNRDGRPNRNRDPANPMKSINEFYDKLPIDSLRSIQVPVVTSTASSSVNFNINDNQNSTTNYVDIDNFDFDNIGFPPNMIRDHEEVGLQMHEQPIESWSVGATAGGQMSQPHTIMSVDSIASRAASASASASMSASMPASVFGAATAGMLNATTNPASVNTASAANSTPSASSQSAIQYVGAGLSQEEPCSELEGVGWI